MAAKKSTKLTKTQEKTLKEYPLRLVKALERATSYGFEIDFLGPTDDFNNHAVNVTCDGITDYCIFEDISSLPTHDDSYLIDLETYLNREDDYHKENDKKRQLEKKMLEKTLSKLTEKERTILGW